MSIDKFIVRSGVRYWIFIEFFIFAELRLYHKKFKHGN